MESFVTHLTSVECGLPTKVNLKVQKTKECFILVFGHPKSFAGANLPLDFTGSLETYPHPEFGPLSIPSSEIEKALKPLR